MALTAQDILRPALRDGDPMRASIVLGKAAAVIRPHLQDWPGDIRINPDPDRGQLSSIQLGLSPMDPKSQAGLNTGSHQALAHGEHGIPAMGYLAEFSNKRWLFPGDTRTYDFSKLPDFGELDGVVGHLWLGKAEALVQRPSKLDGFCHFFAKFKTKQLVITHLFEYGREPNELWDLHHFQLVKSHLNHNKPELKICASLMGEQIDM